MKFGHIKKFKAGNVLYYSSSPDYAEQESFSLVFVESDIFIKEKQPCCMVRDLSVNTYEKNTYRNSIFFKSQSLWIKSDFADKCVLLYRMKIINISSI